MIRVEDQPCLMLLTYVAFRYITHVYKRIITIEAYRYDEKERHFINPIDGNYWGFYHPQYSHAYIGFHISRLYPSLRGQHQDYSIFL